MTNKKIHMIGVCGVAMGTLASMFKETGWDVTGSDENIYPPMSEILKRNGVTVQKGFSENNIGTPDLVVIGNAISRGNEEAEFVLNNKIPYISMARAIETYFLKDKEVVAVSGTHGKTTTTAILAHILETAGVSPSFLVGGVLRNYDSNYKLGNGKYFIIEGDEYDSAFFEKVPKFIFYKPDHVILTSLEFDHADIYNDLDEIERWFKRLVNIVPSNGNIVYSSEYHNLSDIVSSSYSNNYSYGSINTDISYTFDGFDGGDAVITLKSKSGKMKLRSALFGRFNYSNVIAAVSMAQLLGLKSDDIQKGIETFKGVKRRQENIYQKKNISIYEDFAHHPTAIKNVLQAMRERYPDCLLWAIYEPRSATSRRNIFQEELPAAFASADRVIIKTPYNGKNISRDEMLDTERLLDDIRKEHDNACILPGVDNILDSISRSLEPEVENVFLIMSNGGFGGIYEKIMKLMDDIIL